MQHKGGMPRLAKSLTPEDTYTENIKKNSIGKIIEQEYLEYPSEDVKLQYHAFSRDWIANEIFRRVEPQKRTMGEYL